MEHKEAGKKPHVITIENREKGQLSGVAKVLSANETALLLETGAGKLALAGAGIKITKYDVETGVLTFEGTVTSVKYSGAGVKPPLLRRMFS